MLYFAYGSNLDWKQMRERCPSAVFVCKAKLKDHRLDFTRYSCKRKGGVADVVPEEGHDIWGVVYQISEQDVVLLDRCEGFKPGRQENSYIRSERHVYRDGKKDEPLLASLYFAEKEEKPSLPHIDYKLLLVEGARFWHLPEQYIATLVEIETKR